MRARPSVVVVAAFVVVGTGVAGYQVTSASAAPRHVVSLAEAASQPVGIGDHGVAEAVRGSRRDIGPKEVIPDAAVGRGGCDTFYGEPGQCLPLVPPSQAEHVAAGHMKPHWTCDEVRSFFRKGLPLAQGKADPAGLDSNRDGTACGAGDA